jgi:uncharacterized protein with NRDE domain
MCTLIAIKGLNPRYPLVIAANRDELYARPTEAPRVLRERPRALAGVDVEKGGTWLGANEHGVFVGLTNQRTHEAAAPRPASRGRVVLEALAAREASAIDALLDELDPSLFEGFNLMYGDARTLSVAYARPERAEIERVALKEGVWALANDVLGSPEFPKTARAVELVAPHAAAREWAPLAGALTQALGDHDLPASLPDPPAGSRFDRALLGALQALCIHTPHYGTRSATVLALEPGRVARYLHADGAPCRAPFADLTRSLYAE